MSVGCGSGSNILQFLRFGFSPELITANELLPERAKRARKLLPEAVKVICGDASEIHLPNAPFDIILVSTVFSSYSGLLLQGKACLQNMGPYYLRGGQFLV